MQLMRALRKERGTNRHMLPPRAELRTGNLRPLTRKVDPTGEWQRIRCKLDPQLKCARCMPACSAYKLPGFQGVDELCLRSTGTKTLENPPSSSGHVELQLRVLSIICISSKLRRIPDGREDIIIFLASKSMTCRKLTYISVLGPRERRGQECLHWTACPGHSADIEAKSNRPLFATGR